MKPAALLFDLDGTLVDTAADLLAALAALRGELGLSTDVDPSLGRYCSEGALALIRHGIPEQAAAEQESLRQRFLAHYRRGIAVHSRLYPGIGEILRRIGERRLRWAVVTNKPEALARALLDALALAPAVLIGGDSLPTRKPDPAPLRVALDRLGSDAALAWMVGDDWRDVEAARRAGVASAVALWGYGCRVADVHSWGADRLLDQPLALASLLPD